MQEYHAGGPRGSHTRRVVSRAAYQIRLAVSKMIRGSESSDNNTDIIYIERNMQNDLDEIASFFGNLRSKYGASTVAARWQQEYCSIVGATALPAPPV